MLRFAFMRKPNSPLHFAWRGASVATPFKEADFFVKGKSLSLSIEECQSLIGGLMQGYKMMLEERAQMEVEEYERQMEAEGENTPRELEELGLVEDRRQVLAIPEGNKTKSGIVLPFTKAPVVH